MKSLQARIRPSLNRVCVCVCVCVHACIRAHTCAQSLSQVRLFATPGTVASLISPWNFPGKNIGAG